MRWEAGRRVKHFQIVHTVSGITLFFKYEIRGSQGEDKVVVPLPLRKISCNEHSYCYFTVETVTTGVQLLVRVLNTGVKHSLSVFWRCIFMKEVWNDAQRILDLYSQEVDI